MEIERKFLVDVLPEGLGGAAMAHLRQGYLAVSALGDVRVRDTDGKYTLAAKSGAGLAREEREIAIDRELFEELWPVTEDRRLEKLRYTIPAGDLRYEIDVYSGSLDGLLVAEVEFESVEAAHAFEPPEWFGTEVTGNAAYRNASLAARGLPGAAR